MRVSGVFMQLWSIQVYSGVSLSCLTGGTDGTDLKSTRRTQDGCSVVIHSMHIILVRGYGHY